MQTDRLLLKRNVSVKISLTNRTNLVFNFLIYL